MSYCGERCSVKHTPEGRRFATLRCRAWTCPDCQPKRRARLIAEAMRGRPNTFITLTLPASYAARPEEGVSLLAHAWRLIRKREARRSGGRPIPFLAVVERTKAGTPHLHILARSRWIDHSWLSAAMAELAEAPIVDIRRIDSPGRVGGYVAKYVGAEPAKIGTTKRYWQSRDYQIDPRPEPPALPEGHFMARPWDRTLDSIATGFRSMGRRVDTNDDGSIFVWWDGCGPPEPPS